jgi:hypothetical protein
MAGKKKSSKRGRLKPVGRGAGGARRKGPKRNRGGPRGAVEAVIQAWVDDPASPWGLMERPAPVLDAAPFSFSITGEAIPAGLYEPGTAGFRHWNAADSLRRSADLWASLLARHQVNRWQPAATLPVSLDAGSDLNAYYDRTQLAFFHAGRGKAAVYSGESPDIVCHETGHACLDALRPDLWDAPFIETAAFHESFGDITAMLAALGLPQVREKVLGALVANKPSPLSRIAEQLGSAVRQANPEMVEADCLRNAANRWKYVAPESLAANAPAKELSAEPHAFSRVFTGAFHELLSRMLRDTIASPSAADLATVAADAGRLLIDAVVSAPVQPDFFAQVGTRMIDADSADFAGRYRRALTDVFVGRRILTAQAPGGRPDTAAGKRAQALRMVAVASGGELQTLEIDAAPYGLSTGGILVDVPRAVGAMAAPTGKRTLSVADSTAALERSADRFIGVLFENQRIALPARTRVRGIAAGARGAGGRATHALSRTDGHLRLARLRFDGAGW